jgi:hypothetical protein
MTPMRAPLPVIELMMSSLIMCQMLPACGGAKYPVVDMQKVGVALALRAANHSHE